MDVVPLRQNNSINFQAMLPYKYIENPSKSLLTMISNPAKCTFENIATKWGKTNEKKAIRIVFKNIRQSHTTLECFESGFIIRPHEPHLGASPDAILSCDCHGKFPLEIKCPYSIKYSKNLEADLIGLLNPFIIINCGRAQLKKSQEYFYQIQLQMHVVEATFGIFAVWCPSDSITLIIQKDYTFLSTRLLTAEIFFKRVILPEMIG